MMFTDCSVIILSFFLPPMYMGAKQLLQGTYLNKLMLKSYKVFKNLPSFSISCLQFGWSCGPSSCRTSDSAPHGNSQTQEMPLNEISKKKNVLIAAAWFWNPTPALHTSRGGRTTEAAGRLRRPRSYLETESTLPSGLMLKGSRRSLSGSMLLRRSISGTVWSMPIWMRRRIMDISLTFWICSAYLA